MKLSLEFPFSEMVSLVELLCMKHNNYTPKFSSRGFWLHKMIHKSSFMYETWTIYKYFKNTHRKIIEKSIVFV